MPDSSAMQVEVALSERSYSISIGPGLRHRIGPELQALADASHAVIVVDENVREYGEQVAASLGDSGVRTDLLEVPAGEASKSVALADRYWQALLEKGTDRKSLIVAVGGGVVGDLAGFVAATFARGVRFIQVPTTLLAQVDSSVGGKVGINLPSAKNMVGAFWQPLHVFIDTEVLHSLPEREYRSGLAEVVKYGVILDADFFGWLEQNLAAIRERREPALAYLIRRCCELKAYVVQNDEREETGLRAVLNYGHTFCHAIEAESGYGRYLHGEAVAIGMLCASRLAELLGRIDRPTTQRQRALLEALELPTTLPDIPNEQLIRSMQRDKKVEHGKLRFVLPSRMGHVELVGDVPAEHVAQALDDTR